MDGYHSVTVDILGPSQTHPEFFVDSLDMPQDRAQVTNIVLKKNTVIVNNKYYYYGNYQYTIYSGREGHLPPQVTDIAADKVAAS